MFEKMEPAMYGENVTMNTGFEEDGSLMTETKSDFYLECISLDDGHVIYLEDRLRNAYITFGYMHVVCLIIMLIELLTTSFNRIMYFHHMLTLPTVPLYQFAIF